MSKEEHFQAVPRGIILGSLSALQQSQFWSHGLRKHISEPEQIRNRDLSCTKHAVLLGAWHVAPDHEHFSINRLTVAWAEQQGNQEKGYMI